MSTYIDHYLPTYGPQKYAVSTLEKEQIELLDKALSPQSNQKETDLSQIQEKIEALFSFYLQEKTFENLTLKSTTLNNNVAILIKEISDDRKLDSTNSKQQEINLAKIEEIKNEQKSYIRNFTKKNKEHLSFYIKELENLVDQVKKSTSEIQKIYEQLPLQEAEQPISYKRPTFLEKELHFLKTLSDKVLSQDNCNKTLIEAFKCQLLFVKFIINQNGPDSINLPNALKLHLKEVNTFHQQYVFSKNAPNQENLEQATLSLTHLKTYYDTELKPKIKIFSQTCQTSINHTSFLISETEKNLEMLEKSIQSFEEDSEDWSKVTAIGYTNASPSESLFYNQALYFKELLTNNYKYYFSK